MDKVPNRCTVIFWFFGKRQVLTLPVGRPVALHAILRNLQDARDTRRGNTLQEHSVNEVMLFCGNGFLARGKDKLATTIPILVILFAMTSEVIAANLFAPHLGQVC